MVEGTSNWIRLSFLIKAYWVEILGLIWKLALNFIKECQKSELLAEAFIERRLSEKELEMPAIP